MSDNAKNRGLSDDEMRILASVLDEIVPPSADGRMPGAGQAGVAGYLDRALRGMSDLRSMITQGLADLEHLARSRHGGGFTELSRELKLRLLGEQGFLIPLTLHTYAGYYQNTEVLEALGLEPRPPHPQGYEMEADDPSLLDVVRRRPKLYREC